MWHPTSHDRHHESRSGTNSRLEPATKTVRSLHLPDPLHSPVADAARRAIHEVVEHIPKRRPSFQRPDAVLIGSSTGGPEALAVVLGGLTDALDIPIFVVQHMPAKFTKALATRLDAKVASTVVESSQGMTAKPGVCYIAPGGLHMVLKRSAGGMVRMTLTDTEPVNFCKPSVDPLFDSAVDVYKNRLLAVMLTGMGSDGADATSRIGALGCPVIAQDQQSSVVWGMPGAVVKSGAATEVIPVDKIAERITKLSRGGRHGVHLR